MFVSQLLGRLWTCGHHTWQGGRGWVRNETLVSMVFYKWTEFYLCFMFTILAFAVLPVCFHLSLCLFFGLFQPSSLSCEEILSIISHSGKRPVCFPDPVSKLMMIQFRLLNLDLCHFNRICRLNNG